MAFPLVSLVFCEVDMSAITKFFLEIFFFLVCELFRGHKMHRLLHRIIM